MLNGIISNNPVLILLWREKKLRRIRRRSEEKLKHKTINVDKTVEYYYNLLLFRHTFAIRRNWKWSKSIKITTNMLNNLRKSVKYEQSKTIAKTKTENKASKFSGNTSNTENPTKPNSMLFWMNANATPTTTHESQENNIVYFRTTEYNYENGKIEWKKRQATRIFFEKRDPSVTFITLLCVSVLFAQFFCFCIFHFSSSLSFFVSLYLRERVCLCVYLCSLSIIIKLNNNSTPFN